MKKGFKRLTPVSEALKNILSEIEPLESELMHVKDCLNRVIADDIVARYDVPMFDRSAMDGYAIRSEDSFGRREHGQEKHQRDCPGLSGIPPTGHQESLLRVFPQCRKEA